ncbi:RNA polymerase sigma-54 factor RpoN [Lachnospiraceae bacterium TWA4]|nr:RNA polymerase sigma-54 factor RpoN [Lachnospiraceae bacterium TWA4]
MMKDEEILELYFTRNEFAIYETQEKYEKYLLNIAKHILMDYEDAKEGVNDTYLKAWNSIPPNRPMVLSTYLGKITRRTSIDILRKKTSKKRGESECELSLSELCECITNGNTTQQLIDKKLLEESLNRFVYMLKEEHRNIFICRYYFCDSIEEIASFYNLRQSKVKSVLHRTRLKLKNYLEQEGYSL